MRDGGGLPLDANELAIRRKLHDFIGGQQIAASEVVREAGTITGLEAVGLEPGGFLADHLAQPLGRLEVIHPEDLLHPGIGDEGASAFAIAVLELALGSARSAAKRSTGAFPGSCLTLQDRPELKPVACHQPHGALYGLQTAQGGKFIDQESAGALRRSEWPSDAP